MSVVVAIKKNGQVCMAADSQGNRGSLVVSAKRIKNYSKIYRLGDNIIGAVGWQAMEQILEHALTTRSEIFRLASRQEIFESFLALHKILVEEYFIETNEEEDQPVQSNQFNILITNSSGIFEIESYREVNEFNDFWAIGSGRRFALGAMHSLYDTDFSASEIAERAVQAAIEFDEGCGLPVIIQNLEA